MNTATPDGLNMSIEELLKQMEQYRLKREHRDYRPEWLKRLIAEAAGVFEPLQDLGRVGYDCRRDERGWTVCMYLGATEVIGGPRDGHIDHASFRIDLRQLQRLFHAVERLEWYSLADGLSSGPENSADHRSDGDGLVDAARSARSLISVHGITACGHSLILELLAVPPDSVGPGLHCRPSGMLFET